MNVHHLELFYYVARHGGVSAAARQMPYGIQQPAISAQVLRLEQDLGQTLFQRRPFRLTENGEALFRFIEPFFGGLDATARQLRGGEDAHLAIAAQELILRDYLPPILRTMKTRLPKFSFTLHSLSGDEIEQRLLAQQLDLGLCPLLGPRSEGVRQQVFVELPPVLLLPEDKVLRNAATLWKRERIVEPLVCLPPAAPLCRIFQQTLQKRGIEWLPSLELPTLDLVARYVAEGHGIGLTMALPRTPAPPGTRLLPLPGFPKVAIGALWLGAPSRLVRTFIEATEAFARGMSAPQTK
jgi:DNA-binding transcriptional LysR family regulator